MKIQKGVAYEMGDGLMIEIEDLKDKLAYIEREKIVKIEEDITQIKMSQVETNTLVREFSKAMDSQGRAMDSIANAMQEVSLNMRDNNNSIRELKEDFTCFEKETSKNMYDLQEKVCVQEKSFMKFLKDNIWKIITFITIFGIVVYKVLGTII